MDTRNIESTVNTGAQLARFDKARKVLAASTLTLTLAMGGIVGCASTPGPAADMTADAGSEEISSDYQIGVGDTIHVNVWRHEDLSLTVPVRPDGKISVPLLGDVVVGGKTPETVADDVSKELGEFVREPVVTVIVTDMGSDKYRSRVRVTGAVLRPLSAPYRQGMTVLDAVLEAGGLNEFANAGRAALYRKGQVMKVDLRGILNRGDMSTNYTLVPGDVVTVPERTF